MVLGVGRAIGEAMAIIMVAGNVSNMPGLFTPVRFLTTGIISGMAYASVGSLYQQALYSIGLVLFLFIMLINVFKKKAARKNGDFIVHCMMDEIGRLHPNNIKGILQFANSRNIYLINSSPTSYNPYDYRYTYLLSKQGVKTRVDRLLKRIQ